MRKNWPKLLSFFLAGGWFVFAFRHYLPGADWAGINSVLSRFSPRDSIVLDLAIVLWLWLGSWIAGAWAVTKLRLPRISRIERVLFASTLGLSFWSLAALMLAASRLLFAEVVYGLMILVTILGAPRVRRAIAGWRRDRADAGRRPWPTRLLALIFAICIGLVLSVFLISALGPEIEFDGPLTHLTAAKAYAQTHSLEPLPEIPQTFFPRNVTMLFALGMLIKGEACAKLIQFLLGVLCLLTGYALAARVCRGSCGWVAAAILASSPLLLWEMRTAHLELGLTLYVSLALFATVLWLMGEGHRFWWLGAYFLAFAQGTKYHALWALLILPIVVLVFKLSGGAKWRASLADTARFSLFSAAGLIPWGLVNLVQTGNPVFPFLNDIFRSPYWNAALTEYGAREMGLAGLNTAEQWLKLPAFLWYMVTDDTGSFRGNIGPFYLLLLPLWLFLRRWPREAKIVLLFSALYSLVWLFAAQHARYFLPLLPGLAAVSSVALICWLQWLDRSHRVFSVLAGVLLFSLAFLNSPLFEPLGANARYGSVSVMDKLPWAYLAGVETKDQYLSRLISNHEAVLHFNQLPGPRKVVFWWTAPNFLAVENGGFGCYYSPYFPELRSEDPGHLRKVLADNRVTHLIVDQAEQDGAMATRPDGPFAQAFLKRVFQKNGVLLYQVEDNSDKGDTVVYDFLSHIPEAEFRLRSGPAPMQNAALKQFVAVAGEKRWAVALSEGEAGFPLRVPERPVFKCFVGAQVGDCTEPSLIEIAVQAGERETSVFRSAPESVGWRHAVIDLSAFENQDVKVVFRVLPTRFSACGVYYWADPFVVRESAPVSKAGSK